MCLVLEIAFVRKIGMHVCVSVCVCVCVSVYLSVYLSVHSQAIKNYLCEMKFE